MSIPEAPPTPQGRLPNAAATPDSAGRRRDDERFAVLRPAPHTWAVAAIHGEADRLADLHAALAERLRPADNLIYLGNLLGRGPAVGRTIEELLLFRRAMLARRGADPRAIVYLRGGQEEMWQKLLQLQFATDPREVLTWMLGQGVGATLEAYGGSREARVRLPLEVYQAVRSEVGSGYAVGCRFLAEECIDGGTQVDDSLWYGVQFTLAGMDFLSTSRGGKFDDAKQPSVGQAAYPYTGRSGYECMPQYLSDAQGPFGRNRAATARIRQAIHAAGCTTPVVCTGGVHNFDFAEAMLTAGDCDVVGTARQSLADPDWALKTLLGRADAVRLCEYTNYCEGLDQKHKQVTCQLWDREDLNEPGIRMSHDGKRRLVAPAWKDAPAGLEQ